jgi:hypothetical protein
MCDARGMRYVAVILVVLASAGYAAATTAKDVPPFVYRFQVTSVSFTSTFTKGNATATTKLHLSARPKQKTLAWRGKKDYSSYNGVGSVVLRLAGTVTYAGLDDPACNVTLNLDGSRWNPTHAALILVNARDRVVTKPMIRVSAGRFPMAATYPRRGSTCPERALPWWDGGEGNRPLSIMRRAGFTFTDSGRIQVEDGGVMKWTVTMTVRKVHYRPIG